MYLITNRWTLHASAMFFNPKHRKKIGAVWAVLCVLIIISMVLLYFPALWR
ncbi:MAG TPA: hypothetical protein VJJ55_03125 [Candidatus Paceibacterota bacterium]